MPIRVELIDEAVDDLNRYVESGKLPLFLKKLVHLEDAGKDAGLPLGGGLTGWRKIVVGDRNWRIVFTMNDDETVATVWVIGDRDDAACYEDARRRVRALGKAQPETSSLAAVMLKLTQVRRQSRRRGKRV